MATLRGRRLNGRPWVINLPTAGVIEANSTPPALTGIAWHPLPAIAAGIVESRAGKFIAGTFDPVGGVGPFVYSTVESNTNGFTTIDSGSNRFATASDKGNIVVPYDPGQPNTVTLRITDATGATVTKPITIDTSATAPGIYISANRGWSSNINPYLLNILPVLWNGSAVDGTTQINAIDPSGYFTYAYGAVSLSNAGSNFPPPGVYPISVSASGYASQTFNVTIVAAVAGTPYFVQTLSPVSTSVLAGTVVGKIVGTTPNNTFFPTLTDPSGVLGVDGSDVIIAKQPATAAQLSFTFKVTDQGGYTSASCSSSGSAALPIVSGTTLPSTNISFAGVTQAFNNDTWNNTIGTPTVTGIAGIKQWTLVSQTGLNPLAISSPFGTSPARYQIDKSTGKLTAPAVLSAGLDGASAATDTLVISCTDGINTCTAALDVMVSWAPVSQTYHVGRGMAAAHGGNGFEHIVDLRPKIAGSDVAPHSGTYRVLIYADADPDYYTNDTGTTTSNYAARFPWSGPIIVEGVPANGVPQPRMGGPAANNVGGGGDMRGKGFWVFGNGDALIRNVEISGCHDNASDGTHGVEAIRKDGETYGNLIIQRCFLHDNDNNMLSGVCHGTFLAEFNQIENAGTAYVSSGATHNAYIGEMGRAIFRNNVSRRSTNGYDLKCRAMVSEIYNNRFLDGLSGSGSALIDLPFAGEASVYGNYMEKGPMALGPDTIRYAEEGIVWSTNTLAVHDNTIAVLTLPGGHYGGPSVIGWFGGVNSRGIPVTGTFTNNAVYIAPGGTKILAYNGASAASVVETGTTALALPAPIGSTRPDLSIPAASAGPLYRHFSYGQDTFIHFDGAYHYQDRDQIQIPRTIAAGTTICSIRATNQLADQGVGTANPFGPGTTWNFVNDPTPYGGFTAWAAVGKYTITANGDGSAALKIGTAGLATGVDYLQLRATAANGTISDSRYAIAVS